MVSWAGAGHNSWPVLRQPTRHSISKGQDAQNLIQKTKWRCCFCFRSLMLANKACCLPWNWTSSISLRTLSLSHSFGWSTRTDVAEGRCSWGQHHPRTVWPLFGNGIHYNIYRLFTCTKIVVVHGKQTNWWVWRPSMEGGGSSRDLSKPKTRYSGPPNNVNR